MDQAEAEELAQTLEAWAALVDPANDLALGSRSMLQAASVIRRQAETIASLRHALQQARVRERLLD